MRIMLLSQAGVGGPELGCNHANGHPGHGEMGAVGMTQDVEGHRRRNARPLARLIQGALLMGGTPAVLVGAQEYVIGGGQIFSPLREGPLSLPRPHRRAGFSLSCAGPPPRPVSACD